MSYELKDCPFCGECAHLVCAEGIGYANNKGKYWVRCSNQYGCSIEQREMWSLEKAVEAWNKRAQK